MNEPRLQPMLRNELVEELTTHHHIDSSERKQPCTYCQSYYGELVDKIGHIIAHRLFLMEDAWEQDARSLQRTHREWNEQDDFFLTMLTTEKHYMKMVAGLPYCSCGHPLHSGNRIKDFYVHRMQDIRLHLVLTEGDRIHDCT